MSMKAPDFIGMAFNSKTRVAVAHCSGCPVQSLLKDHRADYVWMGEDKVEKPVCLTGWYYHYEKACRVVGR